MSAFFMPRIILFFFESTDFIIENRTLITDKNMVNLMFFECG